MATDRHPEDAAPTRALPVRLLGTGAYLPAGRVLSTHLDAAHGRAPGTTQARSGVVERRWAAPEETSSAMAAAALQDALAAAGLAAEELDALILTAAVPEQPMPTTAVLTLARLGLPGGRIDAFDINATCLGFLTAVQVAAMGIAVGRWRRVGIAAVDLASRGLNHADIESSALFGDGAAAAVLGPSAGGSALLAVRFDTHPSGARLCELPAGGTRWNPNLPPPDPTDYTFRMDGLGVMKLAARTLPAFLRALLDEAGIALADIDVVVPHQASGLGLRFLKEKLGITPGTVIDLLAEQGNQVAASLPSALHASITSGRLRRGGHALLIGTAAGLTLGGAVLRY